jgi:hypothetical protein
VAQDPETELRRVRTRALVRHARAVDAIFEVQEMGAKASPEQVKELHEARRVFEDVRPYGSHDAEAAYKKNPELVGEAAGGKLGRAIRALQLETELRTDPGSARYWPDILFSGGDLLPMLFGEGIAEPRSVRMRVFEPL